jgi:hypothetical protein
MQRLFILYCPKNPGSDNYNPGSDNETHSRHNVLLVRAGGHTEKNYTFA